MGFPDTFKIPVSDTQAYRQFGNSVVVPVMREAALVMKPHVMLIKNKKKIGKLPSQQKQKALSIHRELVTV